tara:strand:+ start:623 stop:988 length:366 start_codon:yes stop_codon:yes gene_type:complete
MLEVRKIKTKEEYEYISKMHQKNKTDGVDAPTHVLYDKEGNVAGVWSLAVIPLVLAWSNPEIMKKTDSIYLNETLAALMDEKGYDYFYIACDKDSPYYKHMDKFGYKTLNWAPSLFFKNLK